MRPRQNGCYHLLSILKRFYFGVDDSHYHFHDVWRQCYKVTTYRWPKSCFVVSTQLIHTGTLVSVDYGKLGGLQLSNLKVKYEISL